MLKCRMKRGVTGLRPPPGGAHADTIVTSCVEKKSLESVCRGRDKTLFPNIETQNQHSFEDLS